MRTEALQDGSNNGSNSEMMHSQAQPSRKDVIPDTRSPQSTPRRGHLYTSDRKLANFSDTVDGGPETLDPDTVIFHDALEFGESLGNLVSNLPTGKYKPESEEPGDVNNIDSLARYMTIKPAVRVGVDHSAAKFIDQANTGTVTPELHSFAKRNSYVVRTKLKGGKLAPYKVEMDR